MTTTPPDLYLDDTDPDPDDPLKEFIGWRAGDLYTWAVRRSRWRTNYEEAE